MEVGKLIGLGLVSCISAWKVQNPAVLVMRGAPTDNNATLFYDGYMSILQRYFSSHKYALVGQSAGTWIPATAETEFQGEYVAHRNLNAAVVPNDENAGPIVSYLQSQKIPPKTFPLTGQDATLVGLDNILSGYQCGTVYKPIYLEAEGAAALAIYARARLAVPKTLINGKTTDPVTHKSVPSILLSPEWVTAATMKATIIKDNFVPASQLCAGKYAKYCKAVGINP